jgi:hypothetical protein
MSEWRGEPDKACTICGLRGVRSRGMHGSRIRRKLRNTTPGFEFSFISGRADCLTVSDWCNVKFDACSPQVDPSRER